VPERSGLRNNRMLGPRDMDIGMFPLVSVAATDSSAWALQEICRRFADFCYQVTQTRAGIAASLSPA
jgi:hypothetical protein